MKITTSKVFRLIRYANSFPVTEQQAKYIVTSTTACYSSITGMSRVAAAVLGRDNGLTSLGSQDIVTVFFAAAGRGHQ
jgi:hypothetical protein